MARTGRQESRSPTASRCAGPLAIAAIIALLWVCAGAQELTFIKPSGEKLALSSLRGKVVVLVFSGAQDPQCRDEFKALDFLNSKYQDKPVAAFWVSISPADPMNSEALTSACGSPGSVPILSDPSQTAFKRFSTKIPEIPTIVIIGKDGQISGKPLGGFSPDPDFLEQLGATIDGLLVEK